MELRHCAIAYGDNDEGRCAWCGDPLPPRRTRWCSNPCSRAFATNHFWTSARDAARERAVGVCEAEGCFRTDVEVHHLNAPVGGRRRYGAGCWNHQTRLLVLCHDHHAQETRLERQRPGTVLQLELVA